MKNTKTEIAHLQAHIPADLKKQFKIYCAENGVTATKVLIDLITNLLNDSKTKK